MRADFYSLDLSPFWVLILFGRHPCFSACSCCLTGVISVYRLTWNYWNDSKGSYNPNNNINNNYNNNKALTVQASIRLDDPFSLTHTKGLGETCSQSLSNHFMRGLIEVQRLEWAPLFPFCPMLKMMSIKSLDLPPW